MNRFMSMLAIVAGIMSCLLAVKIFYLLPTMALSTIGWVWAAILALLVLGVALTFLGALYWLQSSSYGD